LIIFILAIISIVSISLNEKYRRIIRELKGEEVLDNDEKQAEIIEEQTETVEEQGSKKRGKHF